MQQLTQNMKSGEMNLLDVPVPALLPGNVLVRVHYSAISAGTEGNKVNNARKGYIGKAKAKPDQVKQVLDTLQKEGIASTYRRVMNKLDMPAPLGYSCAGEVIAVSNDVRTFKVGDRVSCGGASAGHAEIVSVPVNLVAKVPDNVHLKDAAFTTIAAIALQGIRQADLRLAETCAVIGLGLIGQFTVQMLKAAGIRVVGIDIADSAVALAKQSGADIALTRNHPGIEERISEFTGGYGVDAVIITAATASHDPVNLAGSLCRKKGKVVIVGAVPTGFDRDPYYLKELDLRMSSSYGPGRYDPNYEEKGQDYPIGYVRWTENRNMQAYLELLAAKQLDVSLLTTHEFAFADAQKAYEMIVSKSEPFLGILLKYDTEKPIRQTVQLGGKNGKFTADAARIGFIGAGSFAQNFLLPNCQKHGSLVGVATASGNNARNIADKYGFQFATGNAAEIHTHNDINTVFIATRHNLHAQNVLASLKNGKHVFVEKPLCMTEAELTAITEAHQAAHRHVMVGYNRRFSPHIAKIRSAIDPNAPKSILYRVNAGFIPPDSWYQDPQVGGGRIIGEVCHFVDLCMFLAGSHPVSVHAVSMDTATNLHDTLSVNLKFKNGSVANISYVANGSKRMDKEYIEVHSDGVSAQLFDFRETLIFGKNKDKFKSGQDKGHAAEVKAFLDAITNGTDAPIPFPDIYISTLATLNIIESIQTGTAIHLPELKS